MEAHSTCMNDNTINELQYNSGIIETDQPV